MLRLRCRIPPVIPNLVANHLKQFSSSNVLLERSLSRCKALESVDRMSSSSNLHVLQNRERSILRRVLSKLRKWRDVVPIRWLHEMGNRVPIFALVHNCSVKCTFVTAIAKRLERYANINGERFGFGTYWNPSTMVQNLQAAHSPLEQDCEEIGVLVEHQADCLRWVWTWRVMV
ncbi:hypothetical protein KC19_1G059400 [Ceratodon purpureus]|uniref:Uncharacterized protein n=1 Tax=Ceratodon purpureus TaxID=3225 RepID=A0A8T0J418_CERPU|nr:hypothetical protein KC19_1G059400 [Ceratodon purpureus]